MYHVERVIVVSLIVFPIMMAAWYYRGGGREWLHPIKRVSLRTRVQPRKPIKKPPPLESSHETTFNRASLPESNDQDLLVWTRLSNYHLKSTPSLPSKRKSIPQNKTNRVIKKQELLKGYIDKEESILKSAPKDITLKPSHVLIPSSSSKVTNVSVKCRIESIELLEDSTEESLELKTSPDTITYPEKNTLPDTIESPDKTPSQPVIPPTTLLNTSSTISSMESNPKESKQEQLENTIKWMMQALVASRHHNSELLKKVAILEKQVERINKMQLDYDEIVKEKQDLLKESDALRTAQKALMAENQLLKDLHSSPSKPSLPVVVLKSDELTCEQVELDLLARQPSLIVPPPVPPLAQAAEP